MNVVNGLCVDGPLDGQVLTQWDGGANGIGHCENNDETKHIHYRYEQLGTLEFLKNPIEGDDRVITGRFVIETDITKFPRSSGLEVVTNL